MRKLIFQEWISMDAYAADANGSVSFIESTTLNKYSDLDQLKWMESIDLILLGANTYKLFVEFWPTATTDQEIIADKLNSIPKVVFSKSLSAAPWGKYPDARIVRTDAAKAIKELKLQQGKDMVLWGSISLAQSLMKANLIDEYHLRICPVALGSGRPLFENTGPLNFELYNSKRYESGLMLLEYRQQS
jgi:dihydrofolate reductase